MDIPTAQQRLFHAGQELKNTRSLIDYDITQDTSILLVLKDSTRNSKYTIDAYGDVPCPPEMKSIIAQASQGLALGLAPRLSEDGTSGTYFLRNARKTRVAVFKPEDEEPFAPNNPRGYTGPMGHPTFRKGIRSGEGNVREVAACLVDHGAFAGVPPATRVEMDASLFPQAQRSLGSLSQSLLEGSTSSKKVGSLQAFADCDSSILDVPWSKFDAREVQKIAVLDIRLFNTDRNEENILMKRVRRAAEDLSEAEHIEFGQERGSPLVRAKSLSADEDIKLIPIDHGLCLPDAPVVTCFDWVWLDWPQIKQPVLPEVKEYVRRLDIEADVRLLRTTLSVREPCLEIMRVAGTILQRGVAAGLTLHQIALVLCRPDLDRPSPLEIMWEQAEARAKAFNTVSRRGGTVTPPAAGTIKSFRRSVSFHVSNDGNGFKHDRPRPLNHMPPAYEDDAESTGSSLKLLRSSSKLKAPEAGKAGLFDSISVLIDRKIERLKFAATPLIAVTTPAFLPASSLLSPLEDVREPMEDFSLDAPADRCFPDSMPVYYEVTAAAFK